MPAAAVIPAPIAYIKVAAVKKLVVGSRVRRGGPVHAGLLPLAVLTSGSCSWCWSNSALRASGALNWVPAGGHCVYLDESRVFKAGHDARICVHGIMENDRVANSRWPLVAR